MNNEKPIDDDLRRAVLRSFVRDGEKGFAAGKQPGEINFTTPKGKVITFRMTIDDEDVYCHYPTNLGYDDWRWDIKGYYRLIRYRPKRKRPIKVARAT